MALFGCAFDEQYLNELEEDSSDFVLVDYFYSDYVNRTFVPLSHFNLEYIKSTCKSDHLCLGFNCHYAANDFVLSGRVCPLKKINHDLTLQDCSFCDSYHFGNCNFKDF